MKQLDDYSFGDMLRGFRQRARISQNGFAVQLGRHRNTIRMWERGDYLPQTIADIYEIARVLTLSSHDQDILLSCYNGQRTILSQKEEDMFRSSQPDQVGSFTVWNVPYMRNPYFIGRHELLDRLEVLLQPVEQNDAPRKRKVERNAPQAIKGLGGIGKTQIVVEYAYRSRDVGRYTHTLWVNAASEETMVTSFALIAAQIPTSFIKDETDQRKLMEAIRRWLEQCQQSWLLIFDNADEFSLVQDYLPQGGNGSVLLTTRTDAVGSMARSIEVDKMGLMEGTHFLLHRAQRFDQASDEEINEATNIVIALDHFPLALDQAGAYIEEMKCSFVAYLQMYQTHRDALLMRRGYQSTHYPDTVATTWSVSFQKIEQSNPASAELLRLCAFLAPDTIPEELIRGGASHYSPVLQQATMDLFTFNQMIAELLKFSLIKRFSETQYLSIHRLVQIVQIDTMPLEEQKLWAERATLAVNEVFPADPQDVSSWPQCLRYLDQTQACYELTEQYMLALVPAADLFNRTGLYLDAYALYALAEPLYQHALSIQEEQLGKQHLATATTLNNLGHLYQQQGKYEEAKNLYYRALDIREEQLGKQHLVTATTLDNLGRLYHQQGKYEEAEEFYHRVLTMREEQLGKQHLDIAITLTHLANLYQHQNKYKEAEELYYRVLDIREKQLGKQHLDMASSMNNLANLYQAQGKYIQAEPLYQQAFSLYNHLLGSEHIYTAGALQDLAFLYRHQGKYREAELLYQKTLLIHEQWLGSEHIQTARCLNDMAALYRDQGKYEEAVPLFQRALFIYEQRLGPNHPNMATGLINMAALYRDQGKYEEAVPLFQRALSIREDLLGPESPDTAHSIRRLAGLYHAQGKYELAEPLFQRALSIYEKCSGPENLNTAHSLNDLANLYQDQRKYAEAELVYQRVLAIYEQQIGSEHPSTTNCSNKLATLRALRYQTEAKKLEKDL